MYYYICTVNTAQTRVDAMIVMESFMQQYRAGKITASAIDDFIDQWHTGKSTDSLPDFLGMTQVEYQAWLEDPDTLPTNNSPLTLP